MNKFLTDFKDNLQTVVKTTGRDIDLLQVLCILLPNPEIKEFFKKHNVDVEQLTRGAKLENAKKIAVLSRARDEKASQYDPDDWENKKMQHGKRKQTKKAFFTS